MNHTFTITEGECDLTDDLPAEIDFTNLKPDWAQTEKRRAIARANLVKLDPELIAFFKTPEAINEALRRVMREMQNAA